MTTLAYRVAYLGSCPIKGCRTTARIALDHEERREPRISPAGGRYEQVRWVAGLRVGPGSRGFLRADEDYGQIMPACVEHRRTLRMRPIAGVTTDRTCGGRCRAARGPDCECQCGGENHGRLYG